MIESEDEYSARFGEELRELEGALPSDTSDTIDTPAPTEPVYLPEATPVGEAVARVPAAWQPGVPVIEAQGLIGGCADRVRLTGPFPRRS